MDNIDFGLYLKYEHYEIMLNDVNNKAPEEACGLVAGLSARSEKIYVVTNIEHSPFRFRMAAEEQLRAFNDIESQGYELLAIYHSHPNGPVGPSAIDLNEYAYPDVLYLIWSMTQGDWVCLGYQIVDRNVSEVQIKILKNEQLSE